MRLNARLLVTLMSSAVHAQPQPIKLGDIAAGRSWSPMPARSLEQDGTYACRDPRSKALVGMAKCNGQKMTGAKNADLKTLGAKYPNCDYIAGAQNMGQDAKGAGGMTPGCTGTRC
jgi:hypothetical protein